METPTRFCRRSRTNVMIGREGCDGRCEEVLHYTRSVFLVKKILIGDLLQLHRRFGLCKPTPYSIIKSAKSISIDQDHSLAYKMGELNCFT